MIMIRTALLILTSFQFLLFNYGCKKEDEAFLKIDKSHSDMKFDSNGGSLSVPINSNYSFDAFLSPAVDWCHVTIVGQSVKVLVDKMNTGKDRSAELHVTSKGHKTILHIHQNAITINEKLADIVLTNEITEFSLEIISSTPIEFDYPEWIQKKDADWVAGTKRYIFVADGYFGSEDSRSGTLTVRAADPSIGFTISTTVMQTFYTNEAILKLHELWSVSPFQVTTNRWNLLAKMEEYSKQLSHDTFQAYLIASTANAEQMEKANPILSNYRHAFDYVLNQVKNETPEQGSTVVWLLYNMGFIVKTPSICFGIDLNHRLAERFEPYLDFMCVTHDHADHKSVDLMDAMYRAGKPVLSNFYTASRDYYSTSTANYTIGNTHIRTNITDHDATLKNFTTVYRIEAGEDSGNFSILHCGDSSFDPSQYTNVGGGSPSMLILRSGTRAENNIVGTGSGKVDPKNVFLSHLIELRHRINESPKRFTILGTVQNVQNISVDNTYVPFWGERFVWKDGKLQQ